MARDPNTQHGKGAPSLSDYPIATSFAFTILAALGALVLLRHLFGSVHLEVGTR